MGGRKNSQSFIMTFIMRPETRPVTVMVCPFDKAAALAVCWSSKKHWTDGIS